MGSFSSFANNSGNARLAGLASAAQQTGLDKAIGGAKPAGAPAPAASAAPAAAPGGASLLSRPAAQTTGVPDDIYRKKTLLGA